jgi:GH35 family endo-1,4-beta-xylanase
MTDPEELKGALRDHAMNVAVRYKNDWTYLDAINERESGSKPEKAVSCHDN